MDFAFDHAKTLQQETESTEPVILCFLYSCFTLFRTTLFSLVKFTLYVSYVYIINKTNGKVLKKKCKHGLLVKLYNCKSVILLSHLNSQGM